MLVRGTAAIVATALLIAAACGGKTERDFAGTGTGEGTGLGGSEPDASPGSGGAAGSGAAPGTGAEANTGAAPVPPDTCRGPGAALCDGECVSLLVDSLNCGVCGKACPLGSTCDGGECVCMPGLVDCGGECTDLTSDRDNCGACGNVCRDQSACYFGVCDVPCAPGLEPCGQSCVDLSTSLDHCGACYNACAGDQVCTEGVCQCPVAGETLCGSVCVDTTTDPDHCGACYEACPTGDCVNGQCCGGERPSCCGALDCNGESCCTSIVVPGGTFPMGRGTESCADCTDGCPGGSACSDDEVPEHPARVSTYYLDKYEVTVGRFAVFLEAFDAGWRPSPGQGANAAVETAQGLVAGATGWQSAWDSKLPSVGYQVAAGDGSLEDLVTCASVFDSGLDTWTDAAGANTSCPMNCVSWYEAFAFCIWDGTRLPTEAEWECAAAGGDENRVYPWGNDVTEPLPANYAATGNSPFIAVGSYSSGNGRWGHADLTGSMLEWTLDWYASDWYASTQTGCLDCATLAVASDRVLRGGIWSTVPFGLRAASRYYDSPDTHNVYTGWRCSMTAVTSQ
jgi:sulfatase modifying factor 1